MDVREVGEAKKQLEAQLFKAVNDFELNSGCTVTTIAVKHRLIEGGEYSRKGLDKVVVKIAFPDLEME